MTSISDAVAALEPTIRADLERVETMLRRIALSDQAIISEMATHLIDAGGKRFRPMLVLLAGTQGDPTDERLVPCATAIEMTHLATLYHDDVIDETLIRRGVPTVNVRYGNSMAVLTGDFLLARASGVAADLGPYVSRRLADTIAELCEGQIMETEPVGRAQRDPARYIEVIRRKTASLVATSCHLGAWLAGAEDAIIAGLTNYGEALGMAFQLADDILDIAGDAAESGKEPGTDLREGVLTMPALDTLNGAVPGGAELEAALAAEDIGAALTLLRGNGSLDRARAAVASWQAEARAALDDLHAGPGRDAFMGLIEFTGARTS